MQWSTYWMLSFLASFILHLLCNEILWNSQANVQTPQWNTGVPGKERQQSVRVRALFTIHWFLNAAEMQQHSLEVEHQIITPAVLSLPKGELPSRPQASSYFWRPAFSLAQALTLVRLFDGLHSIGWSCPALSYPIHFACWVNFPLLWLAGRAQVQEEPEAGVCGADADIITFPNVHYHIGDWCLI